MHKARRNDIIAVTETELANSEEPTDTIKRLHTKFISTNRIENHVVNPSLKRKLTATPSMPSTHESEHEGASTSPISINKRGTPLASRPARSKKRRQSHPSPDLPKKQLKLDHFLDKSIARSPQQSRAFTT